MAFLLEQIIHARLGAQFLFEDHYIGLGNQIRDNRIGIIGIAEERCAADAGGHALGQQTLFQAMQAKVAFTHIADRRLFPSGAFMGFAVLVVGCSLIIIGYLLADDESFSHRGILGVCMTEVKRA